MGRRREKISRFFTRYGLRRKRSPAIGRSPAPQTSLIFELPVELMLSILSHISPEPRLTGHYARFREQYCMEINDDHQKRVRFLRPLSMTCMLMRLRLLPWMWELIEPSRVCWYDLPKGYGWYLTAITNAVHADTFLAASVRFMRVHFPWNDETSSPFVECLKSLPNLHTLEIGLVFDRMELVFKRSCTPLLKEALEGIKFPQIKTLILPPAVHLLLEHCPNVEDLDWVIRDEHTTSDEFLGSLASIRDSKIKRLAIPLVLEGNPSRFVEKCPRLVELTVLYPHPHPHYPVNPTKGYPPCPVETTRSAISEMVDACKALPDFKTLEIVYLTLTTPPPTCWCWVVGCSTKKGLAAVPYSEWRKEEAREEMRGAKDWAIDCLKKLKMGSQEGEGKKKAALKERTKGLKNWAVGCLKKPTRGDRKGEERKVVLRVIELTSVFTPRPEARKGEPPRFHLGSVKVEECEVWEVDSDGL